MIGRDAEFMFGCKTYRFVRRISEILWISIQSGKVWNLSLESFWSSAEICTIFCENYRRIHLRSRKFSSKLDTWCLFCCTTWNVRLVLRGSIFERFSSLTSKKRVILVHSPRLEALIARNIWITTSALCSCVENRRQTKNLTFRDLFFRSLRRYWRIPFNNVMLVND